MLQLDSRYLPASLLRAGPAVYYIQAIRWLFHLPAAFAPFAAACAFRPRSQPAGPAGVRAGCCADLLLLRFARSGYWAGFGQASRALRRRRRPRIAGPPGRQLAGSFGWAGRRATAVCWTGSIRIFIAPGFHYRIPGSSRSGFCISILRFRVLFRLYSGRCQHSSLLPFRICHSILFHFVSRSRSLFQFIPLATAGITTFHFNSGTIPALHSRFQPLSPGIRLHIAIPPNSPHLFPAHYAAAFIAFILPPLFPPAL